MFENHLNPVMLVFVDELLLSSLRRIPMCQGVSDFFSSHRFVLINLATGSTRVNCNITIRTFEFAIRWTLRLAHDILLMFYKYEFALVRYGPVIWLIFDKSQ